MLVPDYIPFVEVTDFSPEIAMWHVSVVLVSVWVMNWIALALIYRCRFVIFTMYTRLMMIDWFWLMVDWLWRVVDWSVVAMSIDVRISRGAIFNSS